MKELIFVKYYREYSSVFVLDRNRTITYKTIINLYSLLKYKQSVHFDWTTDFVLGKIFKKKVCWMVQQGSGYNMYTTLIQETVWINKLHCMI